ncbi:hypothetical protein V8D89_010878 [Ganoderma adspersum]
MDGSHRLKGLLQLQLASDSYAVLHLPFVLETLSKEDFLPSPHTQKWIARVNSLIHSKDPGAKWSGLCLAFQTATFSKDLMLECAQSWVGAAMPLFLNQPPPTTKAAIRLLRLVFSSAMDVPEFQRQLCLPNFPKFVNALIMLVEKETNMDITLPVLETLAHMVSLYPSLCRPLHAQLSHIALRSLNGSTPTPVSGELVEASSRLYADLPLTGGKVNAPTLWRKCLDDTVAFAWGAFLQVRTTYPDRGYGVPRPTPPMEDPVVAVPLALDRLCAAARVIGDLVRTVTSRPVSLPLGPLVRFCSALLQCTLDEKGSPHADLIVHALEASVIPMLWTLACEILNSVSQAGQHHLTPHLPSLLTNLAYHLEQPQKPVHMLQFIRTTSSLLADGSHMYDNVIASRVVRATLPLLAAVLSKRSQAGTENEQAPGQSRSKKGKKRARGYEGDEVFKVGREIVCSTAEEGEVLLASVDLLGTLLRRTEVHPPVHSIASRLLLAICSSLPQLPPAILSSDLSLHPRFHAKLQTVCVALAIGTTNTASKALGLVLKMSGGVGGHHDPAVQAEIDLLLHPRVPPLVRSLPHVEMLSLFRTEEGEEELDTRRRIGLDALPDRAVPGSDVSESQMPLDGGRTSPWKSSRPSIERGNNSGTPSFQARDTVPMQVDAPTAPVTIQPSQLPAPPSVGLRHPQSPAPLVNHPAETGDMAQSPLPPPPDPLPSGSGVVGPKPATASIPPATHATHATTVRTPICQDDDSDDADEPMPAIDLGSDSESE